MCVIQRESWDTDLPARFRERVLGHYIAPDNTDKTLSDSDEGAMRDQRRLVTLLQAYARSLSKCVKRTPSSARAKKKKKKKKKDCGPTRHNRNSSSLLCAHDDNSYFKSYLPACRNITIIPSHYSRLLIYMAQRDRRYWGYLASRNCGAKRGRQHELGKLKSRLFVHGRGRGCVRIRDYLAVRSRENEIELHGMIMFIRPLYIDGYLWGLIE
ncbi:hypothetical protein F5Y09DRAFT_23161 [Xylaria sp. FL1042]|nr:hypothetical protein F5Y09DRAFT_23161 [Xylaria sp. FL1042]